MIGRAMFEWAMLHSTALIYANVLACVNIGINIKTAYSEY